MVRTRFIRLCAVYAVLVCVMSAAIAVTTGFNVHPDESIHGDAFCYFQNNFWPPPLNTDGLRYSPDGMSRVYNGEVVYLLWGRLAAQLAPATESLQDWAKQFQERLDPIPSNQESRLFLPLVSNAFGCTYDIHVYRLFNTLLLAITLIVLLYFGRRLLWPLSLAAVLASVPQVIYVYSYANSDAWGLSMSIFLFTFAVSQPRPLASVRSTVLLGVLTAMVALSKQPYLITLLFSYLWIVIRNWRQDSWAWSAMAGVLRSRNTILLIATVVALVFPLRVLHLFSIPNYQDQVEHMREVRAWDGFKPSDPKYPGFRLAATGVSFNDILTDRNWYWSSVVSLYGKFGYLTVELTTFHYQAIAWLVVALTAFTYWFGYVRRRVLPSTVVLALWISPMFIALNVIASIYNSWTFDFQPQGRYLFPSLIPLSLMLSVTLPYEPRWMQTLRIGIWFFACTLCLWTLYQYVLHGPGLVP